MFRTRKSAAAPRPVKTTRTLTDVTLITVTTSNCLTSRRNRSVAVVLSQVRLFDDCPRSVLRHLFSDLLVHLGRRNPTALIRRTGHTLPRSLHRATFTVTASLILSSHAIAPRRRTFLSSLCHVLRVPNSATLRVIRIVAVGGQNWSPLRWDPHLVDYCYPRS